MQCMHAFEVRCCKMLRLWWKNAEGSRNLQKQGNAVEGGRVGCCNANKAGAIVSALRSAQCICVKDGSEHSEWRIPKERRSTDFSSP